MSRPVPAADRPDQPPMEDPMTDDAAPHTPADATATQEAPTPADTTATQVMPAQTPPAPSDDRHVRVGTVVWGLVLAAIGAGLLAASLGVHFDVELAFIVLVAAAGVLLLVGSVASSRRRRS